MAEGVCKGSNLRPHKVLLVFKYCTLGLGKVAGGPTLKPFLGLSAPDPMGRHARYVLRFSYVNDRCNNFIFSSGGRSESPRDRP